MLAHFMSMHNYPNVPSHIFYRDIFPPGELAEWSEDPKSKNNDKWEYTGIILEFTGVYRNVPSKKDPSRTFKKEDIKRHTVCDDLSVIEEVCKSNNFCCMSPISYVGKNRKSENARFMYALCVELDNLRVEIDPESKAVRQIGMENLISQWSDKDEEGNDKFVFVPKPTYVVCSGNGVHLYYVFEDAIPLYNSDIPHWTFFKRRLTQLIWNKYTTISFAEDEIQYESLFQPFRLVGSVTKSGGTVEAFKTGGKVTIDYLEKFCRNELQGVTRKTKSEIELGKGKTKSETVKLEVAKELWPDWYNRVVLGIESDKPKGSWVCNRAVYDWWLDRIEYEATVGHRYFCLMTLAIYAIKCGIEYEELEADCMRLYSKYESMTVKDDNHFTEKDVLAALQAFEDNGNVMHTTKYISGKTGIHIEPNERHGNKRKDWLHAERVKRKNRKTGEVKMTYNVVPKNRQEEYKKAVSEGRVGRPAGSSTKEEQVKAWRKKNPNGTKADCVRDTGISKPTVLRWWE